MSIPSSIWGKLASSVDSAHNASLPTANHLELTMIIYGSNSTDSPNHDIRFANPEKQRRLEVIMRPKMPEYVKDKHRAKDVQGVSDWVQDMLRKIVPSLKHSQNWYCEFCGASSSLRGFV